MRMVPFTSPEHPPGALQIVLAAFLSAIVATGAVASLLGPEPVLATHSVPSPRIFWDCNVDGQPDESCARITMAGTGWDSARQARFTSAVSQWSANTDFDPYLGSGNLRQAFVAGQPACGAFTSGEYAVTCVWIIWVNPHYRIGDADVWFNTAGWVWNTGSAANLARVDFQGVAVHEIGHFLYLIDLSAANCGPVGDRYTMCGAATKAETFQVRDLEQDDKNAANTVY